MAVRVAVIGALLAPSGSGQSSMRRCYQWRIAGPEHGACLSARPTPGATPAAASIEGKPSVRPSILRLTRFDAAGAGFDTALRDRLAPVIGDVPGLHAVIGGRMGPGQDGPRLVATVWTSREAMEAAIGAGIR